MPERFNSKKRIIFPVGKQTRFILLAERTLDVDFRKLANMVGIHFRTMSGWKKEQSTMPLGAVQYLCNKTGNTFPKNIMIKDQYWYVKKGGKNGGAAIMKKYGRI